MSAESLEIDVRKEGLPHFTLMLPLPFSFESDQLDRAMQISCRHYVDHPPPFIGGPELPSETT